MSGARPQVEVPLVHSLGELAGVVRCAPQVFIRFSDDPRQEAVSGSVDYESGLSMPGLSANPLTPEGWWTRPLEDWLARQVRQYAHLSDRSASHQGWVLLGRVVARGPDAEPLLTEVEPLARLSDELLVEASERYQQRFDPGRTSA